MDADPLPNVLEAAGQVNTDYNSASDRINKALDTLRKELVEMRGQDVRLLKQLIQISETIRKLTNDRVIKRQSWWSQRQFSAPEQEEVTRRYCTMRPLLVRQCSEPQQAIFSCSSSVADSDSPTEELCTSFSSDLDNWTSSDDPVQLRARPHSVAALTSPTRGLGGWQDGESSYEEILKRNIRLWKCYRKDEADSIFPDTAEEEESERQQIVELSPRCALGKT